MTSPEFLSVTKLLAMVMMTGSMICTSGNEWKRLYRNSDVKSTCIDHQNESVDLHVPLVGRVDGKPGQHTGESLSPLEREQFVSNVSSMEDFHSPNCQLFIPL